MWVALWSLDSLPGREITMTLLLKNTKCKILSKTELASPLSSAEYTHQLDLRAFTRCMDGAVVARFSTRSRDHYDIHYQKIQNTKSHWKPVSTSTSNSKYSKSYVNLKLLRKSNEKLLKITEKMPLFFETFALTFLIKNQGIFIKIENHLTFC